MNTQEPTQENKLSEAQKEALRKEMKESSVKLKQWLELAKTSKKPNK